MEKVKSLEGQIIKKSIQILKKKRISRTDAMVLMLAVRLIEFTHGLSCRYPSDD